MRFAWSLLVLAACPPKPAENVVVAPPPQLGGGVGCPSGADVWMASYVQPAENEKGGHSGWVLPLLDKRVDAAPGPEYQQLDPAAAAAAGVPQAPTNLWMLIPGQQPCRPQLGSYYAANVNDTPQNIAYGVELNGCAPPQQDGEAIVVVSPEMPGDCQIVAPKPIASRLGESDQQKRWTAPKKQTAIPPDLAAIVPAHDCAAPGCEQLWSIVQVDVNGAPAAWGGTINWLHPDGSPQCSWANETFSGFFAPGEGGHAVKVADGQDHPLILTGVLADKGGAKVLLAEGAGEYATYDLAAGAAPKLAHHLTWLIAPAEAYAVDDRIGPECPHNAP